MDRITIFERDISNIPAEDIGTNIVYVPGYAVMGPINTPTLCRTLREFQETFGTEPYIFEENQNYSSLAELIVIPDDLQTAGVYALENTKELSYYYVTELLNKGLVVLFERVVDEGTVPYAKKELDYTPQGESKFVITSKYPGKFYKDMNINLSLDSETQRYTLISSYTLLIDGFENLLEDSLVFSFNPTDEYYIGSYDNTNKFIEIKSKFVELSFIGTLPTLYGLDSAVINAYDGKLNTLTTEAKEFSIATIYNKFVKDNNGVCIFDKLTDRGEYEIKFISSGVYPTLDASMLLLSSTTRPNIVDNLLKVACLRGDALGIIDYFKDFYSKIEGNTEGTLFYQVNRVFKESIQVTKTSRNKSKTEDARTYGTMFTPWANYSTIDKTVVKLPSSFSYLISLATSVKTNPNWYATAGVTRGVVPNLLSLNYNVTGAIADSLQGYRGVSINPITLIRPYGYTIWGNRTLLNNNGELIASSLLNIKSLACDVKKAVYVAAKKFMFEPISEILWLNFKSEIEPLLDKMKSGNGLTKYEIIRELTTEKATICAVIRLWAVDAVEKFDVTIELSDSYVNIE